MNTIFSIARQYGSGGKEIGKILSQQLDIPFYDKELITMAADESGISEEVFQQADERASSSLLYSLMMGSYTLGNCSDLNGDLPVSDNLFLIQANLMKKLAAQGPCVIVGRCADFILHNNKNLFRVFIHADRFARMDRVVQEYGIEPEKAAQYLVKKDRQRANYYSFYTNRKWGDPDNYDLMLDSSTFSAEKAAELILNAAESREKSPGSGGEAFTA
ncbi:MAG TPA: cytidylate kinase-like family protein [Caproiciproducens sp.]|nr:cytidylate kinase-like family protein [Caproiciproducens sp.]